MKTNKTECPCLCHVTACAVLHNDGPCPGRTCSKCDCQKEQPEQEVECPQSKRVDGKFHSWQFDGDDPYVLCHWCGERQDALSGQKVPQPPQSPRPELKCKCNDIEYCSTCIDSPKAPVSWKDRLNKCFRFKRSLDDRHIYYLADDDDDETQYGYLDQFIEVLMMQAEQKARAEAFKAVKALVPIESYSYYGDYGWKRVYDINDVPENYPKEHIRKHYPDEWHEFYESLLKLQKS